MSTRNKARKSTGGQASTNTLNGNISNNLRRRSSLNQRIAQSSSSDSDVPTQRIGRGRNSATNLSIPGTSGETNSRVLSSDFELDEDETERLSDQRRRNRNQREQSSSDTTSDSDEAPVREKIQEINNPKTKKAKVTKLPTIAVKRTKKQRNRKKDSSDSEEELSNQLQDSLPARNISGLVNKCVYYLLIADQKKYPIKRQDIIKHVFINQDNKLYPRVIEEANGVLKKTYGMEVLTHEKRKGEYLLINIIERELNIQEFIEFPPSELEKRGLIFYLLTVIFMNENSISEDDLWTALKPLGIDVDSRTPHPIFGDARKYITGELVKQMYLERKCICKEPPQFELTWGVRATQEVDKKDLLNFACVVLDHKPEDYILQYKDMKDSAKTK